jgi:hypothetical protein
MCRFDAIDCCFGRMKCSETHHRLCDFLDEAVILFNQILQLFDLKNFNKTNDSGQHQQEVKIF